MKSLFKKILWILFFLIIIFLVFRKTDNKGNKIAGNNKTSGFSEIIKNTVLPTFTLTPTITPSLTPTPTPTPTPTIPPGFCLKVPVLMYHHIESQEEAIANKHTNINVTPDYFDSQMKYLNDNGYKTISADDLVNALISHQELGKVAVVTMDDGYVDNYNNAYQIAKKYNIVLNLMIATGLMENSGYLSWGQLSEMVNSGSVFAYDHTWSHYPPLGDLTKLEWEIKTAKDQLKEHLGKEVKIFSYPYGTVGSYEIDILQRNGFIAAFTTVSSFYQCENTIFYLPRIRIGNTSLSFYGI